MTVPEAVALHTLPDSVHSPPLTPPSSDTKIKPKSSPQVLRVIKLLRNIQHGRHIELRPWCVFRLKPGEYDEIGQFLESDGDLKAYVEEKVRYL